MGFAMNDLSELPRERLKAKIRDMIFESLQEKYVSTSSHLEYQTGNAYQEITLDGKAVGGFRKDRSNLFKAFNFDGRTVLDCGCNLGELSRLARQRGASLVDGVEYDSYFVQIAQLINAYHNVTRVSFSQADLTKPGAIRDTYGVTLAFSVFPYVLPVMDKLASATTDMLILETHNITSDFGKVYLEPVNKYFPYNTFVDFTDFGRGEGKRAVYAFAKTASALGPSGVLTSSVNISRSDFPFLEPIMTLARSASHNATFPLAKIKSLIIEHGGIEDDVAQLTAGRTYWIKLMKGYLEYKEVGYVGMENTYAGFLRTAMAVQKFDPALAASVGSEDALIERVTLRYRDADLLCDADPGAIAIAPIVIFDPKPDMGRMAICHGGTGNMVYADLIDGYHRVFWARLLDRAELPALYTTRK
jgi:SAM-dependent methyltransferase